MTENLCFDCPLKAYISFYVENGQVIMLSSHQKEEEAKKILKLVLENPKRSTPFIVGINKNTVSCKNIDINDKLEK